MSKITVIVVGITAAIATLGLGPGTASAGYQAYVANGAAAGEVKIFDLDTGTTTGSTLTFGASSVGVQSMALTSDAATLYTADSGTTTVDSRISFASSSKSSLRQIQQGGGKRALPWSPGCTDTANVDEFIRVADLLFREGAEWCCWR